MQNKTTLRSKLASIIMLKYNYQMVVVEAVDDYGDHYDVYYKRVKEPKVTRYEKIEKGVIH